MLVLTLVLAAVGFGMLVVSLMTGSVLWAWLCIVACVIGAVLLLASGLSARNRPVERGERSVGGHAAVEDDADEAEVVDSDVVDGTEEKTPQRRGRHEKP
ncbi:hypothetical protein [Antrihabitans stalactiti]|uniref:DUF2207 domain-containing protein n=1 Tax=Antrihabitans stalactiti TaxID=2584121 RepID=A0A848KDW9_9NOCA|nr:hypothetical protein [Antrihabitans stalactiti]